MLSARIKLVGRPGLPLPLPAIAALYPERIWSKEWRAPLLEILNAELSHPQLGISAIVVRLLETFLIQGLRSELRTGSWRAPGWLGALTDPVLRTGLIDAGSESALASVGALSAEVHRSPARVRARVRGFSGAPPGRLLRQLRMEHALRQLEQAEPTLEDLARELGYAGVSTFCRAFRREVGCTPAEYWRRRRNRPFPRRKRHLPSPEAMTCNRVPLDSVPADE
jgi:AraC-like DNA-binding protein